MASLAVSEIVLGADDAGELLVHMQRLVLHRLELLARLLVVRLQR